MATRLRMPPETSSGYLSPMPDSPTWSSAASDPLAIAALDSRSFSRSGKRHVFRHVIESKSAPLEDPGACGPRPGPAAQPGDVDPADLDAPAVGVQQPQQVLEEDDFPPPLRR